MQKRNYFFIAVIMAAALAAGCVSQTGNVAAKTESVKEYYMESFYTIEDGKPHPQFSLREITVNKGDTVRILVNVTKGTHDFKIDELNVASATPTGSVTVIEFVANKAGEFVYYCTMPDHRKNGQWGTLKVLEK